MKNILQTQLRLKSTSLLLISLPKLNGIHVGTGVYKFPGSHLFIEESVEIIVKRCKEVQLLVGQERRCSQANILSLLCLKWFLAVTRLIFPKKSLILQLHCLSQALCPSAALHLLLADMCPKCFISHYFTPFYSLLSIKDTQWFLSFLFLL